MTRYGITAAAAAILIAASTPALAQAMDGHKIVVPQSLKWSPGPPSLPPGAQAAVLFGDPGKEGLFALRLRLPKGYRIPAHTHPKPEVVTVISGTFRLLMGKSADRAAAHSLPAGAFIAIDPGVVHQAVADEDTVIQLNAIGPWSLTYVNPADDPRRKTQ